MELGSGMRTDGQLECLSCHKIHHPPEASKLLVATRQDSTLCMECHSNQTDVFGSSHDLRAGKQGHHQISTDCDVAGPCAACHGVHSLPFIPVVTKTDKEGTCILCHQADGCAESRTGQPFLHPMDISTSQLDRLKAFTGGEATRGQSDSMTCLSCHNPHSKANKSPMLRGPASENPTELCFECHEEMRPIRGSFHRAEKFEHIDANATDCRGCHAIHAPEPTWQGGLWVAPVGGQSGPGNEQCTGCHSSSGGQHDVNFRPHPALQLTNVVPTDESGYMPLIDSSGKSGATGTIGCVTCHVPHGRAGGGGFSPPDLRVTPEPMVHAMKSMLRPYAAPNLCSSCHGPDGLRLFLHFHSEGRAAIIR